MVPSAGPTGATAVGDPGGPATPLVADDGSVPVIVELAVPTRATPELPPAAAAAQQGRLAEATGRVLASLPPQAAERAVVRRTYASLPFVALQVDPAGRAALERSPDVAAVHTDQLSAPALAESIDHVRADDAQALGLTGAGTAVAIIDAGVDSTHPMLDDGAVVAEACFAQGPSFTDAGGDCPNGATTQVGAGAGAPCPWTSIGCWHGTHVASTAAGRPVLAGSTLLRGVAPDAGIVAINVFSRFTGSQTCGDGVSECIRTWTSDQLAALDHVIALLGSQPIVAVNLSLGGGANAGTCDGDARAVPLGTLRASGVLAAISSGNDGNKAAIGAPGCISSAITVGASDDDVDVVAGFSNSTAVVDVLAPGVGITAAYPGSSLATANGTSMAAPHVAGAIALLAGAHPTATPDDVEAALEGTGVPIVDPGNGLAIPRIDVAAALVRLGSGGRGGGISNDGTLTLINATVTGNAAWSGGGLAGAGTTTVRRSIVADQAEGRDCGVDPGGALVSEGWNLVGDTSCGLAGTGDQAGVDPLLGALGDNGGATPTHLPGVGSPAIDAIPFGTAVVCEGGGDTDQRNVARPQGGACDVGAVEQ